MRQQFFPEAVADDTVGAVSAIGTIDAVGAISASGTLGAIAVGGESTRQLSIINTGSSPLNISAITIEPPEAPFFTLAEAQTILAAGELTLPVQFFPLMPGIVEAELHILSNANNKEDAVVMLRGEAYDGTICGPCDVPPEDTCIDENNALAQPMLANPPAIIGSP